MRLATHLAFVVSALVPAYMDRLMGLSKGKKDEILNVPDACQVSGKLIPSIGIGE
ncbi:hypothetical protein [Mesorhizobium salmacidum]|uniref:Uncharacterized protein n=1 Tax=Mesorhizobium salmacidum TaxID=3015171 RepID=A0ABU8L3M9_9HYPH